MTQTYDRASILRRGAAAEQDDRQVDDEADDPEPASADRGRRAEAAARAAPVLDLRRVQHLSGPEAHASHHKHGQMRPGYQLYLFDG